MSFNIIKTSIRVANLINWFSGSQKKITDFYPGSVTRTKAEALAVELESMDYQFYRAMKKAIPTSIYKSFNFTLLAPVRASGKQTFSVLIPPGDDIVIAKGALVSTEGSLAERARVYETLAEGTLLAASTSVDIQVACTIAGEFGNVGAGVITVLKTTIPEIDSVTNAAEFANGRDKETEEDRRVRFVEYIDTLTRGTDAAIEFGAKKAELYDVDGNIIEKVTEAFVVTTPQTTAGFSECYIHNGVGSTSQELIDRSQEIVDGYTDAVTGEKIPGYKAAGIVCPVYAALELAVDVTITLVLLQGKVFSEVQAEALGVINNYFADTGIGQDFILAELIKRVKSIDGVYNVIVALPTTDVEAQQIGAVSFTGVGLDDLTTSGAYNIDKTTHFRVEIDGTGTPDTFKWSNDDGGSWEETGVSITGAPQLLENGVSVTFAATTGHTLGEYWDFSATGAVFLKPGTITINEG
jgi:uncharacterized phage protein gp47/JayE